MGLFDQPFGIFGESAFGKRPESRVSKEPRKGIRQNTFEHIFGHKDMFKPQNEKESMGHFFQKS